MKLASTCMYVCVAGINHFLSGTFVDLCCLLRTKTYYFVCNWILEI